MDIARPDLLRKRRRKNAWLVCLSLLLVSALTIGLSRLRPALPVVDKTSVWTDTVKQGVMVRQVRGNGTLVPIEIQFVQADTEGRIERILALPGAQVKADTVLMELSNPELNQSAFEVEWQLKAAQAQLTRLKVQLESDRLTQASATATLKTDLNMAELDAQIDANLARDGLIPELTLKKSKAKAEDLKARYEIEVKRLDISADSINAQLAVQEAELAKLQALLELKHNQVQRLRVRAGIEGVLQQIGDDQMLRAGQRILPSAILAKIIQPACLKAEIKVPETQAKDVQIGQPALIDTRNGVIPGHVTRVDPAVLNGTVTVDVALDAALPKGARPDLSVDGTIELERLDDAVHVGRPFQSQPQSAASLFKLTTDGTRAVRVPVKLGRGSVTTIEIVDGLRPGERVILSDMSVWDDYQEVLLR